jgi:hypothetical protein
MVLLTLILLGIAVTTILALVGSPTAQQWARQIADLFNNAK